MNALDFLKKITENQTESAKAVKVTKTDGSTADDEVSVTAEPAADSGYNNVRTIAFEESAVIITIRDNDLKTAADNLSKSFTDIVIK